MSDPRAALAHARAAAQFAGGLPARDRKLAKATAQWLEGAALTELKRPDAAKPVLDAALAAAGREQPHGRLYADLLKSRAAIAVQTGDVRPALKMLHRAYILFDRLGEARCQAIVLQSIGSIYLDARDYPRALRYYAQAGNIYKADPVLTVSAHNNRGNAFKAMGDFAAAEREYRLALHSARGIVNPVLEARIITNIASAQFMNGDWQRADTTAIEGLRRAGGAAIPLRPYLWGVRAQVALARSDLVQASRLIERTFAGTDIATTSMPYRDFHETAQHVHARLGEYQAALAHMAAFKRLDDEGRDIAAGTSSALLSARFDAANQQLSITRLKAGQLQRDMMLAKTQQQLRAVTMISVVGGIAGTAIIAAIFLAFVSAQRSRAKVKAVNAKLTHAVRHDPLTGQTPPRPRPGPRFSRHQWLFCDHRRRQNSTGAGVRP